MLLPLRSPESSTLLPWFAGGSRTPTSCSPCPSLLHTGTCQLQVLLIPGNPGSCEYFFPFLEHLHALLGGTAEVLALTHPGHVRVGADNSRVGVRHVRPLHTLAPHVGTRSGPHFCACSSCISSVHTAPPPTVNTLQWWQLPLYAVLNTPTLMFPSLQLWSLEEQIAHKVAFLKEHVLLPGRPPVVLIGHSIGAYMMVKVRLYRQVLQLRQQTAFGCLLRRSLNSLWANTYQ